MSQLCSDALNTKGLGPCSQTELLQYANDEDLASSMVRINKKGQNNTVPILRGARILWNCLLYIGIELRPVANLECTFVEYRLCVIEDHS